MKFKKETVFFNFQNKLFIRIVDLGKWKKHWCPLPPIKNFSTSDLVSFSLLELDVSVCQTLQFAALFGFDVCCYDLYGC